MPRSFLGTILELAKRHTVFEVGDLRIKVEVPCYRTPIVYVYTVTFPDNESSLRMTRPDVQALLQSRGLSHPHFEFHDDE